MTRERPKVVKRNGIWRIQLPAFGFGGKPRMVGQYRSRDEAWTAAVTVRGSVTSASLERARTPEPYECADGWVRRWQPIIGRAS